MWINNGNVEKQIKQNDSIPDGFTNGRLKKDKKIDHLKLLVHKSDLYQFYIIDNNSFLDTMNHFNLSNRYELRLLLKEYKIYKDPKEAAKYTKHGYLAKSHEEYIAGGKKSGNTQRNKWKNKPESEKIEWSNKQRIAHSTESFKQKIKEININYRNSLTEEEKALINKKRSESCKRAWEDPNTLIKRKETTKLNREKRLNKICRTVSEENIYNKLIGVFGRDDVQYDVVVDDRYPYYVDFYIKSRDLFIEYQGHPSHGRFPFNGDAKSLEESQRFYGAWLNTYTKKDPEKYKQAKVSNLNYLRYYPALSVNENYIINNSKNLDIINIIKEST